MLNQVGVTQAWRLQRCKWPTWDKEHLFVPGCHLQAERLQWGKWPRGLLIAEERWSRSRREMSTIVGNESADCKPPVRSCWLHFRSCQKPSPVKNENFVRIHLQSWSSNTLVGCLANSQLIGKDPHAGKDWRQKEKRATEDEMVGWHHWFNGHELGQTLGDGDGQGDLVCCSPWGRKESNMTWQLKKQTESTICVVFPVLFAAYFLSGAVYRADLFVKRARKTNWSGYLPPHRAWVGMKRAVRDSIHGGSL